MAHVKAVTHKGTKLGLIWKNCGSPWQAYRANTGESKTCADYWEAKRWVKGSK